MDRPKPNLLRVSSLAFMGAMGLLPAVIKIGGDLIQHIEATKLRPTGRQYPPNGKRECARRCRQMAARRE